MLGMQTEGGQKLHLEDVTNETSFPLTHKTDALENIQCQNAKVILLTISRGYKVRETYASILASRRCQRASVLLDPEEPGGEREASSPKPL